MVKAKKGILIFAGVAAAVTIAALSFLLIQVMKNKEKDGLEFEANATIGMMPGMDVDKRLLELQNILDDSVIAFSINTNPMFTASSGKCNLLLENPANNNKLITAEVIIDSSQDVVYTSKALVPGSYLKEVSLDKKLPAGQHKATVYFKAYNTETHELIGQTGAGITITSAT